MSEIILKAKNIRTVLYCPTYVNIEDWKISSLEKKAFPKKYEIYDLNQIKIKQYLKVNDDIDKYYEKPTNLEKAEFAFINNKLLIMLYFNDVFDLSKITILHYWNSLYPVYKEIEKFLFSKYNLKYELRSKWQSTLSFVNFDVQQNREEEHSTTIKLLREIFPQSADNQKFILETDNFTAGSSWDGTLVFKKKECAILEEIEFLFKIVCMDWQNFDISKKGLIDLISNNIIDSGLKTKETQYAISDFYFEKLKIDPFYLCFDEHDIGFVTLVQSSWKRDEMVKQALSSFRDAQTAINILHEVQQNDILKNTLRKQEIMNLILSFVGITSFAGTIAAVLTFIDFQNTYLDILTRMFAVLLSSLLFVVWVWRYFIKAKTPKSF